MILVGDDPGSRAGSKAIAVLVRHGRPRSKYYRVFCCGTKRHCRRDGSCAHTDALLARVRPEARGRVSVVGFGGRA